MSDTTSTEAAPAADASAAAAVPCAVVPTPAVPVPVPVPVPSGQAAARKSSAKRGPRETHPLLQRLWQLHPQLFGARFLPLKLGVFEDLMSRHAGQFEKADLKVALGQHVRSTRYLQAVAEGLARHDLDGQSVEPVAPEHVQHAITEVLRRRQGKGDGAPAKAREWAHACLLRAIEAAGLTHSREAWLERVRSSEPAALALVDEAFAMLAERAAKAEAMRRAYAASGASVEAFAEMYGLDAQQVRQALGSGSGV